MIGCYRNLRWEKYLCSVYHGSGVRKRRNHGEPPAAIENEKKRRDDFMFPNRPFFSIMKRICARDTLWRTCVMRSGSYVTGQRRPDGRQISHGRRKKAAAEGDQGPADTRVFLFEALQQTPVICL